MASNIGDLTGKSLGMCTLTAIIGQGGMGAVYLARQARPARNVAVKILHPNIAMNSQVYADFLERFRREADVIARLEHVNIMPIYEYGEQDNLAYLVMPYLTGGSLRDILLERGALSLAETLPYIEQACSALDYAHAQGVIHRDLKPANFLLHADGRLVLADFGIARMIAKSDSVAGVTLTSAGMVLGTPEYMAPEMASGENVDYRADIYELGVVLYQMLSGHVPFTASSPFAVAVKHMQEPLPRIHPIKASIPIAVDAVIQNATAKRREDRYQSGRALAMALRQAMATSGSYPSNQLSRPLATANSAGQPLILPAPTPQYATPQPATPFPASTAFANRANIPYTQQPYAPVQTTRRKSSMLPLLLSVLIALIIIGGGAFAAIQFINYNAGSPSTQANNTTTPAAASTPAAAATQPPTSIVPTATAITIPAVPLTISGNPLYSDTSPACLKKKGTWISTHASAKCENGKTILSNTSDEGQLGGMVLQKIPGLDNPTDYIFKARLQLDQNTSGDFGLYFRTKTGETYIFLIHPSGTWNVYYSSANTTATSIKDGQQAVTNPYTPVTLAVAVRGAQFSFYANGNWLGNATDANIDTGTIGIAIDQKGTLNVSDVLLYVLSKSSPG